MQHITEANDHPAHYLTVREGWYLGYPVIGEESMQLVRATPPKTGKLWRFTERDQLTTVEWERLASANYLHFYLLAGGNASEQGIPTEWMLLAGKPIAAKHSTMRHFKPGAEKAGSGIGV